MFADDADLQDYTGLDRVIEQPQRSPEPVLAPQTPWEGEAVLLWGTVMRDPDRRYRMWYQTFNRHFPSPYQWLVCHAVSQDGVAWEKPPAGQFDFEGTRANNVVYAPVDFPHLSFFDSPGVVVGPPIEEAPGGAFYMMAYLRDAGETDRTGLYLFTSPDGRQWGPTPDRPALPYEGDRLHLYRATGDRGYVLMTRRTRYPADVQLRLPRRRVVCLSESPDLQTWAPLQVVLRPDAHDPDDLEFYSLMPFEYGRQWLGFLEVYHTRSERLEVQLVSSRDGRRWERVGDRSAFFSRGPAGSWDDLWVNLSGNPPITDGDRLQLWFTGRSTPHGARHRAAIGYASIPRDRFVALRAGTAGGQVVTEWFDPEGKALSLNVNAAHGEVRVAVVDERGVVEGYDFDACRPLNSDGLDLPVSWRQATRLPRGRCRLWIQVRRASLYAYRLRNGTP